MVRSKDLLLVGQQLFKQPQRIFWMPAPPSPKGNLATSTQGVGMLSASQAATERKFLLAMVQSLAVVAQYVVVGCESAMEA